MATATASKTTTTKRRRGSQVSAWFVQWLRVSDEAAQLDERASELKQRLMDVLESNGYADDKGSNFLDLSEPVEFTYHDGRVRRFLSLKREKALVPASPMPEPKKAEALLRKLKLWVSTKDEKLIRELQIRNPYVTIRVEVDPDAVAQAYFKGLISEEDYDACLQEQRTVWRFKPLEK